MDYTSFGNGGCFYFLEAKQMWSDHISEVNPGSLSVDRVSFRNQRLNIFESHYMLLGIKSMPTKVIELVV